MPQSLLQWLKLPVLQQHSSLLLLIREFCTAYYYHPKIFKLSCYLWKLALNFIDCSGRGVWKEGFRHCPHLLHSNYQMHLVQVAWFPWSPSTVGSWKQSLWSIMKDQNPLHCHVKGLLKKFIQAWDVLDYWKFWTIDLVHVLYVNGVCCKYTPRNQMPLPLLVPRSEKLWEM